MNGFLDYDAEEERRWKHYARLVACIYDAWAVDDAGAILARIRDIETVLEGDAPKVPVQQGTIYWYGKIADAFHNRDIKDALYALGGLRSVNQLIYKPFKQQEIRCQKKRAA